MGLRGWYQDGQAFITVCDVTDAARDFDTMATIVKHELKHKGAAQHGPKYTRYGDELETAWGKAIRDHYKAKFAPETV